MNEPLYQYNTKIYRIANAQALISGSFIITSGLGGVINLGRRSETMVRVKERHGRTYIKAVTTIVMVYTVPLIKYNRSRVPRRL